MPLLVGFFAPLPSGPCFAIPVFSEHRGSNEAYVQKISQADTVESFETLDIGAAETLVPLAASIELHIGEKEIWAFQKNNDEIFYGQSGELKRRLAELVAIDGDQISPIIRLQIAEFCKDENDFRTFAPRFYEFFSKRAPLGAEIWRDAIIILPSAKRELAARLPPHLVSRVNNTRVVSQSNICYIEVPKEIFAEVNDLALANALPQTEGLCAIFGLAKGLQVRAQTDSHNSEKLTTNPPIATLRGFGSIGRMIAKSLLRSARGNRLLPVGAPVPRKNSHNNPIGFDVCILAIRQDEIKSALARVSQERDAGTIKVAVAVQTNLSTSRRNEIIDNLAPLKDCFDYIFVIENPLLFYRKSTAPQLTLAGRSTKYVRACVDGILQIAWASSGPHSRTEFLSNYPTNGFCLVGRSLGDKHRAPVDLALPTMLSEYLPRAHAKRFVAIGSSAVLSSISGRKFVEDALRTSRHQVVTVETPKRRGATLLAFGIEAQPLSVDGFRLLCEELVVSAGWQISHRSQKAAITFATKSDDVLSEISFACLLAYESVQDSMEDFLNQRFSADIPDVIFTNFRPVRRNNTKVLGRSVQFMHYSEITSLLEKSTSTAAVRN